MSILQSWPRIDAIRLDAQQTSEFLPDTEQGWQAWFMELLMSGQRARVEALARQEPQRLLALVGLLADEKASMAVRLGIGAVLEEFQGSSLAKIMIPGLGALTRHPDALTRADACHFLSLIGGDEIRPWLQACLQDEDAAVREIASETLLEMDA